jgi:hypothetical protein
MNFAFDLAHMLGLFLAEVIGGLEIDPELGRCAEKDGEPQGCVCRNAATPLEYVRDTAYGYMKAKGQGDSCSCGTAPGTPPSGFRPGAEREW